MVKEYLDDETGSLRSELIARHLPIVRQYVQEILENARTINDRKRIVRAHIGLAQCARMAEDMDAAVHFLDQAAAAIPNARHHQSDSAIVLETAFEYFQVEGYPKALRLVTQGLGIAESRRDKEAIRWGATMAAMVLSRQGDHSQAVRKLEQSLCLARELSHAGTIVFYNESEDLPA
jgi:tetratricopeptide (TPR) repeat protein